MCRPLRRLIGNCIDIDALSNDFEYMDHGKFVLKQINVLKSPSSSDDEKISALKHVGNLAYLVHLKRLRVDPLWTYEVTSKAELEKPIGTREKSIQIVTVVMSPLLGWLKHWKDLSPVLRKPLIQSLCMMAHRSRMAQDVAYKDTSLMPIICKLVSDTDEASICRWICYFLQILISDNGRLLTACKSNDELTLALTKAEAIPWDGWRDNVNIAKRLLQLLHPADTKAK